MALKRRDWIFIIVVLAVFATFYAISGRIKTTRVPLDDIHRPFSEMRAAGMKKIEVDARCEECHDGIQIPFPPDHPAKPGGAPMRCLFCHKLQDE